jgi:hypothetical protein
MPPLTIPNVGIRASASAGWTLRSPLARSSLNQKAQMQEDWEMRSALGAQRGRKGRGGMYYFFDFHGAYLGYLDRAGQFFDESGVRWGRLAEGGKVVDPKGHLCGYLNAQGCYFEPNGACRGYLRNTAAQPPEACLAPLH